MSKNKELTFEFTAWETDSVEVEVRLLPNHPVEGERLRFTISLDGSATEAVSYETKGRSEEWKKNVLCNQAVRRMVLPVARKASHRLIFTALDEGVVLEPVPYMIRQKLRPQYQPRILKKSSSFYQLFFIVISVCTNTLNIFVHPILSEVYKGISDPIPHLHPMQ